MVEAEETYRSLSAKAKRVISDGFTGHWSPDGGKLAFSLGFIGSSGVAIYDLATKETDLLIVPGKDPVWSPDGRYIAFVRDREVLRLRELAAAERRIRNRSRTDEEVWIMNADGTEPRRLARGGWPSWSQDSRSIYYHSRVDNTLCSISITGRDAEPKRVMACSDAFPSVSPDNQRVAYLENASLKVKDLASQKLVAEWPEPLAMWGGPAWSPTGKELCLGGTNPADVAIGLWVYRFDTNEPAKVLTGQTEMGSWSCDQRKLLFTLGPPYFEIWVADLDANVSLAESLGPSQTLEEYFQEMLAFYTRRIEIDPQDAYPYSDRAHYYDCLHDRANATADMRRWSAIMGGGMASDVQLATPRDLRHFIEMPFDCQIVFSAERPVNEIPVMSIAFGQKGRWEMKLSEIPMFVASVFGLGLLSGGLDTPPAYADFTFGKPVNLKSVVPFLDPAHDAIDCFSHDGLEMYIDSDRPGGSGGYDLWVSRRSLMDEDWGAPENLGPAVNSPQADGEASVSADGLTLYFSSQRPHAYSDYYDIYMTTRTTRDAPWGPAVNLYPKLKSTGGANASPWISTDGLELYFASYRPGGYGNYDFYVAKRATVNDPWDDPVNLGPTVNTPYCEAHLSLSPDGLLLVFCDDTNNTLRPGGYGGGDMWMTRRASASAPWQPPVNLGPKMNGPDVDSSPRLSPDGRTLYFWSGHDAATWNLWWARIIPIVDFNGDGKVDGEEVLAMAEHWGQSRSLYDIGLPPIGDGVIDANDLAVLAGYIGQEVNDPTLIAHWALDETEGMTAHDSAGKNDAMVLGGATWQPAGGKIGGAVAFDGKDDFVRSGSVVLDPAKGPLSVIAWVKGGSPNKVIVSQASGADWLYLNQYGMLTTGLSDGSRSAKSLTSDAFVTDDQWHRVVLTWDGTNRTLQMDGVEVAGDTQPNLAASSGSLHIGGGKNLGTTTFWAGLIDDVRIYNRAVTR
jgi:Tol biopolymer transport system component